MLPSPPVTISESRSDVRAIEEPFEDPTAVALGGEPPPLLVQEPVRDFVRERREEVVAADLRAVGPQRRELPAEDATDVYHEGRPYVVGPERPRIDPPKVGRKPLLAHGVDERRDDVGQPGGFVDRDLFPARRLGPPRRERRDHPGSGMIRMAVEAVVAERQDRRGEAWLQGGSDLVGCAVVIDPRQLPVGPAEAGRPGHAEDRAGGPQLPLAKRTERLAGREHLIRDRPELAAGERDDARSRSRRRGQRERATRDQGFVVGVGDDCDDGGDDRHSAGAARDSATSTALTAAAIADDASLATLTASAAVRRPRITAAATAPSRAAATSSTASSATKASAGRDHVGRHR